MPPVAPITLSVGAPDAATAPEKIILPVDFAPTKEASFQWMVADPTARTATVSTGPLDLPAAPAPGSDSLSQVEKMINREVILVRQSGADALAVTLKVDAHTSLFLELTNHGGQIEASVRCATGDASALAGHWGQLQESLARQNVQLQPLPDDQAPIKLPSDTGAGAASQKEFNERQPGQNPPTAADPAKIVPTDDAMDSAVSISKSKHNPRHHHGWEKWA
jgi:hypothetical protein